MSDICTDNRFELIAKYKAKLIEATNIETSADEMAVIDNILFREWQMGWLDRLEQPTVDAVPVVRCGECNRHEEPRDTCLKAFIWCNLYNTHKFKDGYCNCGERKDGERRTE